MSNTLENPNYASVKLFQERIVNAMVWQTCLNCEFFVEAGCTKFKAMPPPAIILHGCAAHVFNIPF